MQAILQVDDNTFTLSSRGHAMTLQRTGQGWVMFTDNASRRAYGGLGAREFDSLEAVEAHYKSWRGVALLVA
ncbi:hypothetical protein D3C77_502800 [compost metagenome]